MKDSFTGFYGTGEHTIEQVFKSKDTVFIFDTNILLTLYRCEEETREQFFNIWKQIKSQCWFPHHVCLEYQRNRLTVIKGSRDSLSAIADKLNTTFAVVKKEVFGDTYNKTISRYTNLRGELETLFSDIEKRINKFSNNSIDARNKKIDFFANHDVIRDQIDELTDGRIGPPPANQETIKKLNEAAKTRYKYNVGPGYEDAKDKKEDFFAYGEIFYDAAYGDYYVWNQILEHVKKEKIENVVYVTNDAKSDFFYKIDGKVRGPNESLTTEIKSCGAKEFILQNIHTFLHHANNHFNAKIDETSISELTNAGPLTGNVFSSHSGVTRRVFEAINKGIMESISTDELYKEYYKSKYDIEFHKNALNKLLKTDTVGLSSSEKELLKVREMELVKRLQNSTSKMRMLKEIISQDKENKSPDDHDDSFF
ncbi:PIN-like domain-containing protein [Cronobacter dublinensis]